MIPTGSFARMSCYIKFLDAVPSASENFGFKFQGQVKLLPKLPWSNCGVFEYTDTRSPWPHQNLHEPWSNCGVFEYTC